MRILRPLFIAVLFSQVAAAAPMDLLASAGPASSDISALLWGLTILSVAVVVIVAGLVLGGIILRGKRVAGALPAVERRSGGVGWIYFGVALTTVALIGIAGWTVATMAQIQAPSGSELTIEVDARQWWWKLHYDTGVAATSFDTANEIHIPTSHPVRVKVTSADVIHSFWVPALGGKTDAIPGRINETWLQADKAGAYRGQCVEFCGAQHAMMALNLFADTPADFQRWAETQLSAATPSASGEQQFLARCGGCHTVRGTLAGGATGPDLTHLMGRTTIAAGTLENSPENLAGWIADPQAIKPGTRMPKVDLSADELQAIVSFLSGLK
ncbi:Cytochrome c oxidase polypeptide II [Devosia sp. DBB001]|nr:Cytochrome c oxidase polypeptide II [Devosia sp. DBB001]